jgi:sugar lactone lactonase YvrE
MRITRFLIMLTVVAFVALALGNPWVAAKGPVASFPDRIPFAPDVSPEGVAVDKVGNVYISVSVGSDAAQHDEIWKFTPTGEGAILTSFPPPSGRVGLAVDATGNVYIARALPANPPGVYKVDPKGNAILLPGTDQIYFGDGLAFDQRGNLYVTEMTSFENPISTCAPLPFGEGRIWRIPKGGTAEIWLLDPLLNGTCGAGLGVAVGANGIQFYHGDLYVISSEQGTIVRVPVRADGSPGQPDAWVHLDSVPGSVFPLAMGDGFTLDVHGNAYVAMVAQSAIVRINADDKSQETIAALIGDPQNPLNALLDSPTSIAFGTGKGGRASIFVANMGWLLTLFEFPWGPGPSLMKFDVDVPGLPLP